jgi:hypothetical protein
MLGTQPAQLSLLLLHMLYSPTQAHCLLVVRKHGCLLASLSGWRPIAVTVFTCCQSWRDQYPNRNPLHEHIQHKPAGGVCWLL